jgi:hypothetical protein
MPGWACRTRTGESVRGLSNWNSLTTSPEVGASRAAETLRVPAAMNGSAGRAKISAALDIPASHEASMSVLNLTGPSKCAPSLRGPYDCFAHAAYRMAERLARPRNGDQAFLGEPRESARGSTPRLAGAPGRQRRHMATATPEATTWLAGTAEFSRVFVPMVSRICRS